MGKWFVLDIFHLKINNSHLINLKNNKQTLYAGFCFRIPSTEIDLGLAKNISNIQKYERP